MSTVNAPANASAPSGNSALGALSGAQSLGQTDFLKLLTVQLKSQDPTKPLDSTQFVSQLAQFSSLAGITSLNSTMQGIATNLQSNQLLQGASLVGKDALVPGNTGVLSATHTSFSGSVAVPASTSSVTVKVYDEKGTLMQTLDLGTQQSGLAAFTWDGTCADGSTAPPGKYTVKAEYQDNGKTVAADTLMSGRVVSVAITGSSLALDVEGIGVTTLDQVFRIT